MKRKINDEAKSFLDAIDKNDSETLIELLENNPDLINELTATGNSALSYAISKKRYSIAKILIKFKIDLNSINPNGNSIFQQCLNAGKQTISLIHLILKQDSLVLNSKYSLNSKLIEESPKTIALMLFEMKAQSNTSLTELLDAESLAKVYSSPVLLEELSAITLNYNREWENHEIELLAQTELDYQMLVATEASIASYAPVRAPIIAAAIEQGYIITEVARDGNCFFRAMAVNIYGSCSEEFLARVSEDLRAEAIKHLRNNPQDFVEFFENRESFFWYIDVMEIPGEEADHILIQAFVDATGRGVILHGNTITRINPRTVDPEVEYHLLYDRRHFDGLRHEDNNITSYTIYDGEYNRYFRMSPPVTQGQTDILDEYEVLLSSEWFLNRINEIIPEQQITFPNDFEQTNALIGLIAIFTLLPHKFI